MWRIFIQVKFPWAGYEFAKGFYVGRHLGGGSLIVLCAATTTHWLFSIFFKQKMYSIFWSDSSELGRYGCNINKKVVFFCFGGFYLFNFHRVSE
jgi:hypothetical protein